MTDISLHILELALNAIDSGATLVTISLKKCGDALELQVKDNGSGISDEVLQKLGKQPVSTKGSTGLGVKKVFDEAAAAGGKASVTSGKSGTTVEATYGSFEAGDIGSSVIVMLGDGCDIALDVQWEQGKFLFDTRQLGRRGQTYTPTSLVLIKNYINQNIRLNGGAIL